MKFKIRPTLEFLAFIGLQRFRPTIVIPKKLYRYSLWFVPMVPEVAAATVCGLLVSQHSRDFEFRLLRTKYLKSFGTSIPVVRTNVERFVNGVQEVKRERK